MKEKNENIANEIIQFIKEGNNPKFKDVLNILKNDKMLGPGEMNTLSLMIFALLYETIDKSSESSNKLSKKLNIATWVIAIATVMNIMLSLIFNLWL